MTYREALGDFRRRLFLSTLLKHGGNACAAARELEVHRNSVHRAIQELKFDCLAMRHPKRKRSLKQERKLLLNDLVNEREGFKKGSTRVDRLMALAGSKKGSRWA